MCLATSLCFISGSLCHCGNRHCQKSEAWFSMEGKPSSFHSKAARVETSTRHRVRFAIAYPVWLSKHHLWARPTAWRAGQRRMSWQLASGSLRPLQTAGFAQDIFSDSPLVIRQERALKQASQHSRFSGFLFFLFFSPPIGGLISEFASSLIKPL